MPFSGMIQNLNFKSMQNKINKKYQFVLKKIIHGTRHCNSVNQKRRTKKKEKAKVK